MPATRHYSGNHSGDYSGKVVLVGGAAAGIGRATTRAFAAAGAAVVLADVDAGENMCIAGGQQVT